MELQDLKSEQDIQQYFKNLQIVSDAFESLEKETKSESYQKLVAFNNDITDQLLSPEDSQDRISQLKPLTNTLLPEEIFNLNVCVAFQALPEEIQAALMGKLDTPEGIFKAALTKKIIPKTVTSSSSGSPITPITIENLNQKLFFNMPNLSEIPPDDNVEANNADLIKLAKKVKDSIPPLLETTNFNKLSTICDEYDRAYKALPPINSTVGIKFSNPRNATDLKALLLKAALKEEKILIQHAYEAIDASPKTLSSKEIDDIKKILEKCQKNSDGKLTAFHSDANFNNLAMQTVHTAAAAAAKKVSTDKTLSDTQKKQNSAELALTKARAGKTTADNQATEADAALDVEQTAFDETSLQIERLLKDQRQSSSTNIAMAGYLSDARTLRSNLTTSLNAAKIRSNKANTLVENAALKVTECTGIKANADEAFSAAQAKATAATAEAVRTADEAKKAVAAATETATYQRKTLTEIFSPIQNFQRILSNLTLPELEQVHNLVWNSAPPENKQNIDNAGTASIAKLLSKGLRLGATKGFIVNPEFEKNLNHHAESIHDAYSEITDKDDIVYGALPIDDLQEIIKPTTNDQIVKKLLVNSNFDQLDSIPQAATKKLNTLRQTTPTVETAQESARAALKRRMNPDIDAFLPYSIPDYTNILAAVLDRRNREPGKLIDNYSDIPWSDLHNANDKATLKKIFKEIRITSKHCSSVSYSSYSSASAALFKKGTATFDPVDAFAEQLLLQRQRIALYDRINNKALATVFKRFVLGLQPEEINLLHNHLTTKIRIPQDLNYDRIDQLNDLIGAETWKLADIMPGHEILFNTLRFSITTGTADFDTALRDASTDIQEHHQNYLRFKKDNESLKETIKNDRANSEKEKNQPKNSDKLKSLDEAIHQTFVQERLLDHFLKKGPASNGMEYNIEHITEEWLKNKNQPLEEGEKGVVKFNDYMNLTYGESNTPYMTENEYNFIEQGKTLQTELIAGNFTSYVEQLKKDIEKQLGPKDNDWGKALLPHDKIKQLTTGIIQPYQYGTTATNVARYMPTVAGVFTTLWTAGELSAEVCTYTGISAAAAQKFGIGTMIASPLAGPGAPVPFIIGAAVCGISAVASYYAYNWASANQKDPTAIKTSSYSQQLEELNAILLADSENTRKIAEEYEAAVNATQQYFEKAINDMDAEKNKIEALQKQLQIAENSDILKENTKAIKDLRDELKRREAKSKEHRGYIWLGTYGNQRYDAYSEWNNKLKEIRDQINRKLYKKDGSARTEDETLDRERRRGTTKPEKATYQTDLLYGFIPTNSSGTYYVLTGKCSDSLKESTVLKEDQVYINAEHLSLSDPTSAYVLVEEHRENGKNIFMHIDWMTPQECKYDISNDPNNPQIITWRPVSADKETYENRVRSTTDPITKKVSYQIKKDPTLDSTVESNWTKLTVKNIKDPALESSEEQQEIFAKKAFDLVQDMILHYLTEKHEMPNKNNYIIFTTKDPKAAQYVLAACRFFELAFPGEFTKDSFQIEGGCRPNVTASNKSNKWGGTDIDPPGTKEEDKVYLNYQECNDEMRQFLDRINFKQQPEKNFLGLGFEPLKPLERHNPGLHDKVKQCRDELNRVNLIKTMHLRGEQKKDLITPTSKNATTKTPGLPEPIEIENTGGRSLKAG